MGLNCRKDDLAYIVVPAGWPDRFLDGKYVQVGVRGNCDLGTLPVPGPSWLCSFHVPWYCSRVQKNVNQCYLLDAWLRPIRNEKGDDETLTWAVKPAPVIRKLSEPEFDAACDRWIQGVEA